MTRRWSTAPCKQPVAMAIDTAHHRLFSGCRSGLLAVSDYQAGKVVATAPIGAGVDGAGFDAASADVFASNADGTLTVIHQDAPDPYHVTETCRPLRRRATWDSIPRPTVCLSLRRSLDRPPQVAEAEAPYCPGLSPYWSWSAIRDVAVAIRSATWVWAMSTFALSTHRGRVRLHGLRSGRNGRQHEHRRPHRENKSRSSDASRQPQAHMMVGTSCVRPGGLPMRSRILLVVVAVASLSGVADAHFVLVSPAASLVQNRLGDPQKIAPCGGVSANPTRNTPANPGTPTQRRHATDGRIDAPSACPGNGVPPGALSRRARAHDGAAPA